AQLRRDVYARLLYLPPRFFEQRHSGELISRFTADAARVEFAVTQALSSYVKDSLQLIALLAVCAATDWRLFLLAFGVLPAAALLMYQPLKALSGTFSLVVQGVSAAERMFELRDEPPPRSEGAAVAPLRRTLELVELRVRYPGAASAVLDGVTFAVPAGNKVALVGASGAGKSTLFSALLRFLEPEGGALLWDGA